jgi:phosphoribosylamine--glycine ligase
MSAVKAAGLAAGKGVIIAQNMAEANSAVGMMFAGGLGAAGTEIEELLAGEEARRRPCPRPRRALPCCGLPQLLGRSAAARGGFSR